MPSDIPDFFTPPEKDFWICHLISKVGFAPSTSEARRLIQGGAVEVNGEKITDSGLKMNLKAGDEFILKVGKRRFIKVKVGS